MKRIVNVLLCVILLMTAGFAVSATGDNGVYNYEINGEEYTVSFEDESLSADTKQIIAESLVGLRDGSAQTYGLGCTLFGHDYITKQVSVIHHKVRTIVPRCDLKLYNVTICEDCDYIKSQTLYSTNSIDCCPKD